MNVIINGVSYTEKHARQLGLIKDKPIIKPIEKVEEKTEHKKKFDKD